MPLPLPSLDTRRWSDLVAEGRALIPRHAPAWTDHNVHDPGIMLVELFAWLSEQLLYRANRIPERHLRKFLALAGFPPAPPRPALAVVGVALAPATGPLAVPAGLLLHAAGTGGGAPTAYRTTAPATLAQAALVAVQGHDGARFADLTRAWRDGAPLSPLGADPRAPRPSAADRAPALYLGFDAPIPPGDALHLFLWGDGTGFDARRRLAAEAADRAADCPPPRACAPCDAPGAPCADAADGAPAPAPAPVTAAADATLLRHHAVRVQWEGWTGTTWAPLAVPLDETRGLTLDGRVTLVAEHALAARALGAVAAPLVWLRCRLVSGRFDATPTLGAVVANALVVEQRLPAWRRFAVAPDAAIVGLPVPGELQPLEVAFDAAGVVTAIVVRPPTAATPRTRVLEYEAPLGAAPGRLALELERLDPGLGFPHQRVALPGAPVAADTLRVRSHEPDGSGGVATRGWTARDDLDAAAPTDAAVALDAAAGALTFGTGVRGRLVPAGAPITASYERTLGAAGGVARGRAWSVPDEPVNAALAGPALAALAAATLANARAALPGADAEDVGDALERAAASLWAHERLVELADGARQETLDQLAPARVLALEAPQRATTTLDIERIARDVPGTRVARARAFARHDARVPCLDAPGTVTVVVVPFLPADRPAPGAGLLAAVRRHLERRRLLTTRLLVVGPSYVDVRVTATVRARPGADPARVRDAVARALDALLHPLHGGPAGLGWPFGRDVHRSEVLATMDAVDGVDHVLAATLSARRDGAEAEVRCGNVCVPPTWLVAPLPHAIEVATA